ncbi:MAG: hypothetical protein U9N46_02815 [Euryarchaeota archaeon]|nr:hypothetical protein [Euryarchaeota archaeon]
MKVNSFKKTASTMLVDFNSFYSGTERTEVTGMLFCTHNIGC